MSSITQTIRREPKRDQVKQGESGSRITEAGRKKDKLGDEEIIRVEEKGRGIGDKGAGQDCWSGANSVGVTNEVN